MCSGALKLNNKRVHWAVITCLCNTLIATHCFSLHGRTWTELNKWVRLGWLADWLADGACCQPPLRLLLCDVVVFVFLSARLQHHCSKWIFAYPRFFTEPFFVQLLCVFSARFSSNAMANGLSRLWITDKRRRKKVYEKVVKQIDYKRTNGSNNNATVNVDRHRSRCSKRSSFFRCFLSEN